MSSEVKAEVLQKTQKILGKYVKKPPLTEKLLRKPPFRFLHDVINSVINETGFLKGLFNENELNSENVKEKEAKLAFLNKLIEAVKTITGTNLTVRASKIIAGLEPTETNLLLQAIAKAIDKKLDSSEYISQLNTKPVKQKVNTKEPDKKIESKKLVKKNSSRTSVKSEEPVNKHTKETKKKLERSNTKKDVTTPKETKTKSKRDSSSVVSKSKVKSSPKLKESPKIQKSPRTKNVESKIEEEVAEIIIPVEENNTNPPEVQVEKNSNKNIEENEIENSPQEITIEETNNNQITIEEANNNQITNEVIRERPKSARPKSGDLKNRISTSKRRTEEIKNKEEGLQQRPRSSLRPPSVRPSSARPGAPRLRPDSSLPLKEMVTLGKINVIVENFSNKDVDDDTTVVIQTAPEEIDDYQPPVVVDMPESKGHLVEQILEQIGDTNEPIKPPKVDIDWESQGTLRGKEATQKELEKLKSLIQTLTRTANPLGKLLNYLHEDIEAMQSELEMWTSIKRQMQSEIKKQKLINDELTKPLKSSLKQLEEDIAKQEREILNTRLNILKNEVQIKKLLHP